MDYRASIEFLRHRSKFGIHLGLDRITELLHRLGDPQQKMEIIHVTGTNGKGSVCAMLESMLRIKRKTGLFTSPHLHTYRERFRINHRKISEEDFAALVTDLAPVLDALEAEGVEPPTEFELYTALALQYFAAQGVETAILEAGLGGGLDSTKAARGKWAVITNVALDHMDYLGDTVEDIAQAKAGILEPGGWLATGAKEGALTVINQIAAAQNVTMEVLGQEIYYRHLADDDGSYGQYFSLRTPRRFYESLYIPLLGRHQLGNAGLAVAMAEQVGADEEDVLQGLARVRWPGRLEIAGKRPLIVLDGAHNYHGMAALADALLMYWPQKRIIAVLGMLADKERQKALSLILPQLSKVIISRPPLERAGDWRHMVDICEEQGVPAQAIENVGEACQQALDLAEEGDLVLVSGSLYLVAEARCWLRQRQQQKGVKPNE